jgi:hypothetical protein
VKALRPAPAPAVFDRKVYEIFQQMITGSTVATQESWMRGVAYQFENHNNKTKFFQDCLFSILKQFHENIDYRIDPGFHSLLEEKQMLIERAMATGQEQHEFIEKVHAFTTDTTVSPTEKELIPLFRQQAGTTETTNPLEVPYRYTIVSNAIDGSGQGGQVYPSFHSPELDVYMNMFDVNNEYHGSVLRFSFLREVLSNTLNKKSAVMVELFYCYFDLRMFTRTATPVSGESITNEDETPGNLLFEINQIVEYVLQNTTINVIDEDTGDFQLVTLVGDGKELTWVSFKTTDAPSVEDINKVTVADNFTRKMTKIRQTLGLAPTGARTAPKNIAFLLKDLYDKYFSCICMKNATVIDKILNASAILWEINKGILQEYISNDEYFYKIFLLRNKFIGDKSRATDALLMNKNPNVECIQSSNDENTLFTAFMYNMSSQWLVSSSSTKIWYLSPYINEQEDQLRFLKIGQGTGQGTDQGTGLGIAPVSRYNTIIANLREIGNQSSQTTMSVARTIKEKFDKFTPTLNARVISLMKKKQKVGGRIAVAEQPVIEKREFVEGKGKREEEITKPIISVKKEVLVAPVAQVAPVSESTSYEKNIHDALKNSVKNILSVKTKYETTQEDTTLNEDLIYMLLDDANLLLTTMLEPPIHNVDEMCQIINKNIEGEKISIMLDTLNTLKPILEKFSQISMIDEYGLSYTSTTIEELEPVQVQEGGANNETMEYIYNCLLDKNNEIMTIIQICVNWVDGHPTTENIEKLEQIMNIYNLILTPLLTFLEKVEPSTIQITRNGPCFIGLCFFYVTICDNMKNYIFLLNMRHATRTATQPREEPTIIRLKPYVDEDDNYFGDFLMEHWISVESINTQTDIVRALSTLYGEAIQKYEEDHDNESVKQVVMVLQSILILVNDEFKETIIKTYIGQNGRTVCENMETHIAPLNAFIKTFYSGIIFNEDQEIYLEGTDFSEEIQEILVELCSHANRGGKTYKNKNFGSRRGKQTRRQKKIVKGNNSKKKRRVKRAKKTRR